MMKIATKTIGKIRQEEICDGRLAFDAINALWLSLVRDENGTSWR